MSERCFYEILGCSRTDDPAAIKSAFRRKAKECHPDAQGGCETTFKEVNEAYSILSDPQKRAYYDQVGRAGMNNAGFGGAGAAGFGDFSDIFDQAFGDLFGRAPRSRNGPERGGDLRYDLEITLEDAFTGIEREIVAPIDVTCGECSGSGAEAGSRPETCGTCGGAGQVQARQGLFRMVRTCPTCHGGGQVIRNPCRACSGRGLVQKERRLAVKIPAGIEDGSRIRLAGEGDSGLRGGPPGDLYLFMSVRPHAIFEREGADLFCRATVPMTVAALGGEVEIPTIAGAPTTITLPEGVQTGRRFRLKGQGMGRVRGRDRGDLHVEVAVETPINLTARQRELLAAFAETCGADAHPQSQGFFESVKRLFEGKGETPAH